MSSSQEKWPLPPAIPAPVRHLFWPQKILNPANTANKQRLHNYTRREHKGNPAYINTHVKGSWKSTLQSECLDVDQLRKLTIKVDGTTYGEGSGSSKQEAEHDAAEKALIFFKVSFCLRCIAIHIEMWFTTPSAHVGTHRLEYSYNCYTYTDLISSSLVMTHFEFDLNAYKGKSIPQQLLQHSLISIGEFHCFMHLVMQHS